MNQWMQGKKRRCIKVMEEDMESAQFHETTDHKISLRTKDVSARKSDDVVIRSPTSSARISDSSFRLSITCLLILCDGTVTRLQKQTILPLI